VRVPQLLMYLESVHGTQVIDRDRQYHMHPDMLLRFAFLFPHQAKLRCLRLGDLPFHILRTRRSIEPLQQSLSTFLVLVGM
jgi:hypothetical protein